MPKFAISPKFVMSKFANKEALMKAREDFLAQNHMPHFTDDDAGRMGFTAGYNEGIHNIAFNIECPTIEVDDSDQPFFKAFVRGYNTSLKEYG